MSNKDKDIEESPLDSWFCLARASRIIQDPNLVRSAMGFMAMTLHNFLCPLCALLGRQYLEFFIFGLALAKPIMPIFLHDSSSLSTYTRMCCRFLVVIGLPRGKSAVVFGKNIYMNIHIDIFPKNQNQKVLTLKKFNLLV